MADESQLGVAPVELASGINDSNIIATPTSQQMYEQAFDPAAVEAEKQRKQAEEVQSLMHAASPTPLGKPTNPSVAETLSNLGKVEPEQLGQASMALDGKQVPQGASGVTSVLGNIQQQVPQGPSVQTSTGMSTDPNQLQSSILGGYDQQIAAAKSIAKATEAKAIADQTQFKNAEAAYAKAELERAEKKMQFDADFNGKMADYEKSIAEYKQAAGEKVMPGRLLADMSTGQRVQAGIFMALSAYGAAISGQENQALKVINSAIDKDIDAQKFNLENKLKGARLGIEGSQYLMAQMRQKFGDDVTATLATKDAMLAMTQQQININASKLDQATAGPKSQAFAGQIQIQRDQLQMQMKQAQAQAYMLQKVSGGNSKELSPAEISAMDSVRPGFRDRWVQGYGEATNNEQGKEFIKFAAEYTPAIKGLERIQDMTKGFNRITDLKTRAKIQTELAAVLGSLRIPITGPGILTESERMDILNKVIGNPNAIMELPSLMQAKLQTTLNKLHVDMAERGRLSGLPADSFKTPNKSTKFFLD